VSAWRPIESAPRDGTRVDLWAAERERYVNERITDCRWKAGRWTHHRTIYDDETDDDMHEVFNASHWRPLPSPPLSAKDTSDGKEIPGNPKLNNAEPPTSPSDSAEGE
jgi:hypothetical protein